MEVKEFDAAKYLTNEARINEYMQATFEENADNYAAILVALNDIARARNMTQLAKDAGLSRKGLYKALESDTSPKFETVMAIMNALGLRLKVETA